jgi:predicted hotdog family 3-hydroxylacyl-ACP dehydratase
MKPFPAIADLVPHRPPMVFLDAVTGFTPTTLTATYTPPAGHWSGTAGMPSYLGIEMIAQGIAAHNSLLSRQTDASSSPSLGVLLGTRRYEATAATFPAGRPLTISIEEKVQDPQGFGAFEGIVADAEGRPVAKATVKVFRPADFRDYIVTQRPS